MAIWNETRFINNTSFPIHVTDDELGGFLDGEIVIHGGGYIFRFSPILEMVEADPEFCGSVFMRKDNDFPNDWELIGAIHCVPQFRRQNLFAFRATLK